MGMVMGAPGSLLLFDYRAVKEGTTRDLSRRGFHDQRVDGK